METPFIPKQVTLPTDYRLDPRTFFDFRDLFACEVRILVVTDSPAGGFGTVAGLHLGQVLQVLRDDPWSHARFEIVKAHRQGTSEANVLDNFRFDRHDLSRYDQVWLFGIEREAGADPLGEEELRSLAEFMDGGGGVFATGDHSDLGNAMSARVPRVRSMRRWYARQGPNGEPPAPPALGPDRHDTLVDPDGPGSIPRGRRQNQSDKVPQTIRPRYYSQTSRRGLYKRVTTYPHPVLCGPDGVITHFPDHMHEGYCEVPSDLSRSVAFAGYEGVEYPSRDGHQEVPEVIAWSTSHETNDTTFGALAAYDGHEVGVGRVLVDASWHHWVNTNLVGFLAATDPENPDQDPSVVPKWEAMKAYFRNVALWLARPKTQDCIRRGGWLILTRHYDILITYKDLDSVRNRLDYFLQLGTVARDALGRLASQCQRTIWFRDPLGWLEVYDPWKRIPMPDPPPYLDSLYFDAEQLELLAAGGAVHHLIARAGNSIKGGQPTLQALMKATGSKHIDAAVQRGAAEAVAVWIEEMREATHHLELMAERAAKYRK